MHFSSCCASDEISSVNPWTEMELNCGPPEKIKNEIQFNEIILFVNELFL
jgi:hypothetical protein